MLQKRGSSGPEMKLKPFEWSRKESQGGKCINLHLELNTLERRKELGERECEIPRGKVEKERGMSQE